MTIPSQEETYNEDGLSDDVFEEVDETDISDEDVDEDDDNEDDETEQQEEQEEEFDEIDYNKEKVKIPKSERKTYLQKGYNYDKVHSKLTETESMMTELESITGMNRAEVIKYLKDQKESQEIEKYAYENNVSEEQARHEVEKEKRIKSIENELYMTKRQTQVQEQKASLKDKPFFSELEKDIDDIISKDPKIDVTVAYNYLRGEKLEELLAKSSKKAEKRTIANIQDRAKRGVVKGSEGQGDNTAGMTEKGKKFASFLGLDVKEVAKHVAKRRKEFK
jgi:hypothetical protein